MEKGHKGCLCARRGIRSVNKYSIMEDSITPPATPLIENRHLLRIAMNDPSMKILHVKGLNQPVQIVEEGEVEFYPSQWGEWECASYCIAHNTHIKELLLTHSPGRQHNSSQSGFIFFLMGVGRNTSITSLRFDRVHMKWRVVFEETLRESINRRLTHLSITNCNLTSDAINSFCGIIKERSTELSSIKLSGANLNTESIKCIVTAINCNTRGLQLKDLDLSSNVQLGKEGGMECVSLLSNRHSTLERLSLDEDLFDDELTIAITNALRGNKCLKELHLKPSTMATNSSQITSNPAISRMLCDASSIPNTCASNHTISIFGTLNSELLQLNLKGARHAKCVKVAMEHFGDINWGATLPINEDTKHGVFPHALAWFTRINPNQACHTACYNLLRRLAGFIFRELEWDTLVCMLATHPGFESNKKSLMMDLSKVRVTREKQMQ